MRHLLPEFVLLNLAEGDRGCTLRVAIARGGTQDGPRARVNDDGLDHRAMFIVIARRQPKAHKSPIERGEIVIIRHALIRLKVDQKQFTIHLGRRSAEAVKRRLAVSQSQRGNGLNAGDSGGLLLTRPFAEL